MVPVTFFAGLAFIPLGIVLRRRKHHSQGTYPDDLPKLNWSNRAFRQLTSFVVVATVANVVFGGYLSYSAVDYMDSAGFCGQSCHVMTPQYTAYQVSPHAQVGCVECHVGEGAASTVRAKLNGVSQLVGVATGSYSRPIPTPVHALRPAQETCGKCHWSGKSVGDRLRVLTRFAEDEANTVSYTVLLMHIGGGADRNGIHGVHLGEGVAIEYYSDDSRETISWVGYTDTAGRSTEYAAEDWEPEKASRLARRLMDCTDCHNRPAHTFELAAPGNCRVGPVVNPLTGLAALIVGHVSSASGYFWIKCLKTRGVLFVTETGSFQNVQDLWFEILVEAPRPV